MKKFLILFGLFCMLLCQAEVKYSSVYEEMLRPDPKGEVRTYKVDATYFPENEHPKRLDFSTTQASIIFSENDIVYLKLFDEGNTSGVIQDHGASPWFTSLWLKGKINHTDNTMVFPLDMPVLVKNKIGSSNCYGYLVAVNEMKGGINTCKYKIDNKIKNLIFNIKDDNILEMAMPDNNLGYGIEFRDDFKKEALEFGYGCFISCRLDRINDIINPPTNVELKSWLLSYTVWVSNCFVGEKRWYEHVLVAETETDWYIGRCFRLQPHRWIRLPKNKDGDLILPQNIMLDPQRFLVSCEFEGSFRSIEVEVGPTDKRIGCHIFKPIERDLTFKRDEMGNYSLESGNFMITGSPSLKKYFFQDDIFNETVSNFEDGIVFLEAIFSPETFTPFVSPELEILKYDITSLTQDQIEKGYTMDFKRFRFHISYDDAKAIAPMDVMKLFYEVTVDGEPYELSNRDFPLLLEPTTRLPAVLNNYSEYLIHEVRSFSQKNFELILPENAEVKLVYYPDGAPAENVAVEEVAAATQGDGTIYDLHGRVVSPDNLDPGIYIRNGKKFVKR